MECGSLVVYFLGRRYAGCLSGTTHMRMPFMVFYHLNTSYRQELYLGFIIPIILSIMTADEILYE